MKRSDKLLLHLIPLLASVIIRLLYFTIRKKFIGKENLVRLWDQDQSAILALWHDQILLMVRAYPGHNAKLLISPSKDGEFLARTMQYFGHEAVRGSSSRGGFSAFKKLISISREKSDIVLTPDGPKGPRHELKDGVVQLARLTGRPVVPLSFACTRGHRFQSWDRFLLPYPFCRGVFSFGEPVYYNREEGDDSFRKNLMEEIKTNEGQAVEYLEENGASAV